ncbi:MAG: hypothetical protein IJE43_07990 [Alphaproteobacteria bacterium]|nr:hypothetical protein [Alphaproteobacteria bacterium]
MNEMSLDTRVIEEILRDIIEPIVGDTPVSVQLSSALYGMASKDDVRDLRHDVNVLRKEVEKLIELVGDTSVSEQINNVISQA